MATIYTFGVTRAHLEDEIEGITLPSADWDDRVTRWVEQHAAEAMAHLRHQGYMPEDVTAWGESHPLYRLAQAYVTHRAAARVIPASALQSNSLLEYHTEQADRVATLLRDKPESVAGEDHDPSKQRGGPRWKKGARTTGRFWGRGMKF